MRPSLLSRAEVLKQYRACYRKLKRAPGWETFLKTSGLRSIDILNYWPRINDLAREAGVTPNEYTQPLTDDETFREYARICFHLGKIPNSKELRAANRTLGAHATAAYTKYGGIAEFDRRFLDWLIHGERKFKPIISMPGWQRKGQIKVPDPPLRDLYPFPFLPVTLHDLEKLACGGKDTGISDQEAVRETFARRCGEAFRALGFRLTGWEWDTDLLTELATLRHRFVVAMAPACHYAVLVEAQARLDEPRPPVKSAAFLESVCFHVAHLAKGGFDRTYLVLVGPGFAEPDLAALVPWLQGAGLGGITLLPVLALMRMVAESIRDRATFTLAEFEHTLAGNSIVRA